MDSLAVLPGDEKLCPKKPDAEKATSHLSVPIPAGTVLGVR